MAEKRSMDYVIILLCIYPRSECIFCCEAIETLLFESTQYTKRFWIEFSVIQHHAAKNTFDNNLKIRVVIATLINIFGKIRAKWCNDYNCSWGFCVYNSMNHTVLWFFFLFSIHFFFLVKFLWKCIWLTHRVS